MALAKETNCEKASPQREGVGAGEELREQSSRVCEQGQYMSCFALMGTSGMKGIGKTQLLVNSLQTVETDLPNTKGMYFTFNQQGHSL